MDNLSRLQCQRCRHIFHERDASVKRVCYGPEEAFGVKLTEWGYENRCPECFSAHLDEVWICADCGENTQEEGFDRCAGCQEQREVATAEHAADSEHEQLLDTIIDIARGI